jgi:ribosomal protein L7Ae-like RNA K-turn-binding protein
MSIVLENFYQHVKTKDDGLRHYPNEDLMKIKLPMRALIVGPSGSGKTNVMLNLVKLIDVGWDKIVLLAKDLEEELYEHLIDTCRQIEKKRKIQMLLAITNVKDLPELADFNPKENTMLICDDFICDKAKDLAKLEEIFIRGRKRGISSVFLSQSYFATPLMIRKNVTYIFIKKLAGVMDLKRILAEYQSVGVTAEQLERMYEHAMEGDFRNFFLIEPEARDKRYMFRKNFDPIME